MKFEFNRQLLRRGLDEFEALRLAGCPRTEDYHMGIEDALGIHGDELICFMNAIFIARSCINDISAIQVLSHKEGKNLTEGRTFGDHYYLPVKTKS